MRAAQRREQLLDACRDAVAAHGVEGATFGRVADLAGVSDSLVVRHFGTRQAMTSALLDRVLDRDESRWGEASATADPRHRVDALLEATFRASRGDGVDGSVWWSLFGAALRERRLGERWCTMRRRRLDAWTGAITDAMASGALPPGDAPGLATVVVALADGLDTTLAGQPDAALREAAARQFRDEVRDRLGLTALSAPA